MLDLAEKFFERVKNDEANNLPAQILELQLFNMVRDKGWIEIDHQWHQNHNEQVDNHLHHLENIICNFLVDRRAALIIIAVMRDRDNAHLCLFF